MDPKHRSRALTEGPARAAARAYLHGIGFDAEAVSQADHRRRPLLDRDDAVQLHAPRARPEGQGGHPRGRRHADGAQHDRDLRRGHDGHQRDEDLPRLAERSSPTRSSSSPAATSSTRIVCISGCDKTIPATVMALARLDIPGLMLYSRLDPPGHFQGRGRHDPGGLRGRRQARRGHDVRRGARTSSSAPPAPAPAPAAASSPRTRWRWPSRSWASARWARAWSRPRTAGRPRSASRRASSSSTSSTAACCPSDVITKAEPRERDRRGRDQRRLARTPSSTCSPSRARPASSSRSTTSTASPSAPR